MDNFEWIAGFEDHFGIYHVEFNALEDQPAGTDYPDTWAKECFLHSFAMKFVNDTISLIVPVLI